MADSDDETYTVPLKDQRIFGAGIKRKRVQFVPSSTPAATVVSSASTSTLSLGDAYEAIVLSKSPTPAADTPSPAEEAEVKTCDICKLPIGSNSKTVPHEASIAHQLCLEHSHPPSAIDRTRKGLSYLQAHGWDPDSRVGLGATGEGILAPIKAKEKRIVLAIFGEIDMQSRFTLLLIGTLRTGTWSYGMPAVAVLPPQGPSPCMFPGLPRLLTLSRYVLGVLSPGECVIRLRRLSATALRFG